MSQPAPFRRFPDAAKTLAKILESLAGAGKTGTRVPASLTGVMPYVRVVRHGGPSDLVSDYATVHIDVFSDSLTAAENLSERIREKLTMERLRLGPIILDYVRCDSAPEEMPPWSSGINRFEARYTAVFRRYRVTA